MQHQKTKKAIMEIELMTEKELTSIKGGQWVYWEGEWYWFEDAR